MSGTQNSTTGRNTHGQDIHNDTNLALLIALTSTWFKEGFNFKEIFRGIMDQWLLYEATEE